MSDWLKRFVDWCSLFADIPDPEAPLYEHDESGEYAAKFSDRDYFRHDEFWAVLHMAADMYEERDYLTGDANVAVTIGPADAINFPEVASANGAKEER